MLLLWFWVQMGAFISQTKTLQNRATREKKNPLIHKIFCFISMHVRKSQESWVSDMSFTWYSCLLAVVAVHWFTASFYAESNEHMLARVTSVTNLSPERQPVKIHGCCVWSRWHPLISARSFKKKKSSLENNSPSHLRSEVLIFLWEIYTLAASSHFHKAK